MPDPISPDPIKPNGIQEMPEVQIPETLPVEDDDNQHEVDLSEDDQDED